MCVHPNREWRYPSGHLLLGREYQVPRLSWCLDTSRESGGGCLLQAWAPSVLIVLMFRHPKGGWRRPLGRPLPGRVHKAHRSTWCLDTSRRAASPYGTPPPRAWAPSLSIDLVFRHLERERRGRLLERGHQA